ncbi:MAG: hypothetical protein IJJ20_08735 [Thermoguttaceae bacterium]|nr:hypothetical protein [Thermoguttaceae bacterium]
MKTKIFYSVLALAVFCWSGVQSAQAQYCAAPGCYETGEISCAPACEPTCAPSCGIGVYEGVGCYGDDGCYDACSVGCYGGYCGGGLFAGIGCIIGEAVRIVLTPVHWVASLFCTGTYADCGCAPPYQECYSDPCDMCGNYVGDCVGGCGNPYYGYQGYYAQNPQMASQTQDYQYAATAPKRAAAPQANPSLTGSAPAQSDYVKYDKVETLGQKKVQRRAVQAQPSAGDYFYNEQVLSAPGQMRPTPAQASRNARRVAAATARQARMAR